jgi:hypothetical protein
MSLAKEALRQQMMLRALWRDARPGVLAGWMRDGDRFARGLQAYQANAGALAERALAAAYPTVQQLLGETSFARLARAHWHQAPPVRADVARWGGGLADRLSATEGLIDQEPYLPDVARLEWAAHQAESTAEESFDPHGLERLADTDPARLWLLPRAGTALVASAHPLVSLWQAHRPGRVGQDDRFDAVRAAWAEGRAETALVWRRGERVEVAAVPAADAAFTAAVLHGLSLGQALDQALDRSTADPAFDFSAFLRVALQRGWLIGAGLTPPAPFSEDTP